MPGRLDGKVALITGGAGGFGQAMARLFVREGARVVITDVSEKALSAAADSIGCVGLAQDVTSESRWNELVADVEKRHGKLDILVNNAGILGSLKNGSPEDTDLEDFSRVQAINMAGPLLGCKAAIPAMRRAGGGSIINVSSVAAFKGTWFETSYGMSKAAVKQLTMSVAQYGAKENIRCNALHPGQMETAMTESAIDVLAPKFGMAPGADFRSMMLNFVPMAKFGSADDVAYAALYLASDESGYVTGSSLQVDGGMCVT